MVDVDLAGVGSSLQQQVEEKKGRKKMRRGTSGGGGAGRDKVGGKSDGLGGHVACVRGGLPRQKNHPV